jgi:hypothetical protein
MWLVCLLLLFAPPDERAPDDESLAQLAKVRRIYVDILTGGPSALQIRDLLMTSLQSSRLFIITEDPAKADAALKGAANDAVFTDLFSSSEGLGAHSNGGSGTNSTKTSGGSRSYLGLGISENETHRTEERKHEAIATVRLVSKDGDVIWSTTQESLGGKFLGSAADVADKVTKRLALDFRNARAKAQP